MKIPLKEAERLNRLSQILSIETQDKYFNFARMKLILDEMEEVICEVRDIVSKAEKQ